MDIYERMKLLTFRNEEWMEESNQLSKWQPVMSKNRGDEEE